MHTRSDSQLDANSRDTVKQIREVLECEAASILRIAEQVEPTIHAAIDLLAQCRGRVIVTGMGKMGCIARKAAATFCSTGTPSVYLHPGEAAHGDLGIVTGGDVLVALSYSGQTEEILGILAYIHRLNVPVISLTGNMSSELAKRSAVAVSIRVDDEADPVSLAPTNSTTAALAMCDAIAVTLMKRRGFTKEQFAIFHPGGHLGRKLLLTTESIMHTGVEIPTVNEEVSIRDAIMVISQKRLGAVVVVDPTQKIIGILTDGDLRRLFEHHDNPLGHSVSEHMIRNPLTIKSDSLAAEALRIMEDNQITVLPVTDENNELIGVVHLHNLIRAGLA